MCAPPGRKHPTLPHISRHLEAATGALLLILACSIYILFRSRTIRLYRWLEACDLGDVMEKCRSAVGGVTLPDIVLYSLPDGLYCASYILIMHAIWQAHPKHPSYLLVVFIPLVAVLHELGQLLGLAIGTFDTADLFCYLIPVVLHTIAVCKNWICSQSLQKKTNTHTIG